MSSRSTTTRGPVTSDPPSVSSVEPPTSSSVAPTTSALPPSTSSITTSAVPTTSSAAPLTSSSTTAPTTAGPLTTTMTTSTLSSTTTTTAAAAAPDAGKPGQVNWALIGGIGGGIVAAILIIGAISFFTKAHRASRRKQVNNFDDLHASASRNTGSMQPQPVRIPLNERENKDSPEPRLQGQRKMSASVNYETYTTAGGPENGSSHSPSVKSQPNTLNRNQILYGNVAAGGVAGAAAASPYAASAYAQQGYVQQQQQPQQVSPAQYYQQQQAYQQQYYAQPQQPGMEGAGYYAAQPQQPGMETGAYYADNASMAGGAPSVGPTGAVDYTAQWQKYFAENPGAYEQYLASQQQQQQAAMAGYYSAAVPGVGASGSTTVPANPVAAAVAATGTDETRLRGKIERELERDRALEQERELERDLPQPPENQSGAPPAASPEAVVADEGEIVEIKKEVPAGEASDEQLAYEERIRQKMANEFEHLQGQNAAKVEDDVPAYDAPAYSTSSRPV
ncbi:hypothetical protein BJ741DRAFT_597493 [Chytriomyces cf. hyalinus JEL632]|nr:hypothetical protein BJ741DRAFT_597493 [Chytriomyces cf. hyalinus JEL632]